MLTLRHALVLEPLPRPWLEGAVRTAHDAVAGLRTDGDGGLFHGDEPVQDVRLTAGRHIGPGARYRIEERDEGGDVLFAHRVAVEAWSRASATRVRYEGRGQDFRASGEAELVSADRPASLSWSAKFQGSGDHARYRRARLTGGLDLDLWWAGDPAGPAALTTTLRHPLAQGSVRLRMSPAEDGRRWNVHVVIAARGRGWARPPLALAAFFAGFLARRAVREALEDTAERWNQAVPEVIAMTREEMREEFLTSLTEVPEPDRDGNGRGNGCRDADMITDRDRDEEADTGPDPAPDPDATVRQVRWDERKR